MVYLREKSLVSEEKLEKSEEVKFKLIDQLQRNLEEVKRSAQIDLANDRAMLG